MLEPTTDPLVASRAYSALGSCAFFVPDPLGAEEAIRLAVEYAGDAPTEERAWALVGQAQLHVRNDRFAAGSRGGERGHRRLRKPRTVHRPPDLGA